ncbi:putative RNA methyltransferase [Congregibacter sp.]|uniref:putative RNA methyltransferase n=1 Tax=Congregibacter sp. TaxID=2744308 RepID=UPI003F6C118B
MPFIAHAALRCPLDGLPLEWQHKSLRCPNQHSFDMARQGYVNLLSAKDKRSKEPGDSQAMVAARHRFLESGHYSPIADCIAQTLLPHISAKSLIVDAGCGEGYYLERLREKIQSTGVSEYSFVGFDISKPAMQLAARRFPATWLVASNRNIPLDDGSVDVLIDMFGFSDFPSFARVIRPSGLLLQVEAGSRHLLELRQVIYPELRAREQSTSAPAGFSLVQQTTLSFHVPELDQAGIADLLLMTPHLFRASAEGKKRAASLDSLELTVDVSVALLQRDSLSN